MSANNGVIMTPVTPTAGDAGVYRIRNLNNGKIYVGSSSRLNKRWIKHRSMLRKGIHVNPILQNSWNKHGEDAFIFETLITCHPTMCLWYEQQFLDRWVPEYNLMPTAGGLTLGHKRSEETKRRISRTKTGVPIHAAEEKKRISERLKGNTHSAGNQNHLGHKHSKEARRKIREARAKQVITPEHRKGISEGLKRAYREGRRKPPNQGVPWNKGKKTGPLSPAHRRKISESVKRALREGKDGQDAHTAV